MERITYRITLDSHKNGIQRTLQGFETADKMTRRISINITSSGDTFEIPFDHVYAMMYVTQPNAEEPSINQCVIEDNTILYDILQTDIATEGIVHMQLKIIEGRPDGARKVLLSPKFALEVHESEADDDKVEQTTTYTALEEMVAKAKDVYDHRLESIVMTEEYVLTVTYADGTVYESDCLKEAFEWADGIVVNAQTMLNQMIYQTNLSKAYAKDARESRDASVEARKDVTEKSAYTTFSVDFETGYVTYLSQNYKFSIDDNGDLIFESLGEWSITEETKKLLEDLIKTTRDDIANLDVKLTSVENGLNSRIASVENTLTNYVDSTNSALESLGLTVTNGMLCATYTE